MSLSVIDNSHLDKSFRLYNGVTQIQTQRNLDLTNCGTGSEEPNFKTSTEMRDNIDEDLINKSEQPWPSWQSKVNIFLMYAGITNKKYDSKQ